MTTTRRPALTLSCGAQITLDDRELSAWQKLSPESRWEVMQFSPTAAHIVLSAQTAIEAWEAAWAEYVEALEWYEIGISALTGDNHIFDVSNAARQLADAKQRLRILDPQFCNMLEI